MFVLRYSDGGRGGNTPLKFAFRQTATREPRSTQAHHQRSLQLFFSSPTKSTTMASTRLSLLLVTIWTVVSNRYSEDCSSLGSQEARRRLKVVRGYFPFCSARNFSEGVI